MTLPALLAPGNGGDRHVALRGRGGELYGVRDFRPGDDPRDVHWKATAHRGRLVLRERQIPSAQEIVLLVDHRLFAPTGTSLLVAAEEVERAITMTASLAAALLGRGYRVGLRVTGDLLPLGGGPAQLARILRLLARLPLADADAHLPSPPLGVPVLRISQSGQVTLEPAAGASLALAVTLKRRAAPAHAGMGDWS